MGLLSTLFGGKKSPTEALEQQKDKNFDILKFDGLKAQKMGQIPYSIRCFTEALALKEDFETRLYLSQSYMAQQAFSQALDQLQKLTESDPDYIETYLMIARVSESLKDWKTMHDACQKAFQLDDKRADTYYYYGEASHGLHDDITAIAMLTKAITLKENLAQAYLLRSDILCEMHQYSEAEKDIDYLIGLDTENNMFLLRKAMVCNLLGNWQDAVTYYNKVIELNPFCDQAYLEEGQTLLTHQKLDEALSLYNEAIEINPNFAAAYKERGNIKLLKGDKEGSMDDLKKSLELAPKEGEEINGTFTNIQDEVNAQYKANNPFAQ